MNRDSPIAVVHVPPGNVAAEWARQSKDGKVQTIVGPELLFGPFESIEAMVVRNAPDQQRGAIIINVVWGLGAWGMTQVLAESESPVRPLPQ